MSERELRSWRAYLETGSMKAAAHRLGCHEITVRKHISALRRSHDVQTNAQLAVALEREGVA